jgi:hypothetical protein
MNDAGILITWEMWKGLEVTSQELAQRLDKFLLPQVNSNMMQSAE